MSHRTRSRFGATTIAVGAALLLTPSAAAEARFGDRVLRQGDSGRHVRVLQRWLTLTGFETAVDGSFGRRTKITLRRYERHHEHRVDGVLSRVQARGLRKRAIRARAAMASQPAPPPTVATTDGPEAVLGPDGKALVPVSAPPQVRDAIVAANRIVDKPYRYGGGHGSFEDDGYDCSGTVSYALHGAGLLRRARDSSGLRTFGKRGRGTWMTIYAHGGHAYIVIAGLRLDTSGTGGEGPRWQSTSRSSRGYTVRHPAGL